MALLKNKLKNHEKIKRRKNFFPTLFLAILFWASWGWLVCSAAPNNNSVILVFFFLLFTALFLTGALILANSRRGLLIAVGLIGFLVFRYHDLANFLNLALFAGILISLELYFSSK